MIKSPEVDFGPGVMRERHTVLIVVAPESMLFLIRSVGLSRQILAYEPGIARNRAGKLAIQKCRWEPHE